MSKDKFKKTAIAYIKSTHPNVKVTEEGLRYLRSDILACVNDLFAVEGAGVLMLVLTVLKENGVRRQRRTHLER